jgi:serine/threonine protein phosphatase PrpC
VATSQRSAALLRSIAKDVDVDEFVFTLDVVINTLLKIKETLHPTYSLRQKLQSLNSTLDAFERWLATSSPSKLVENLASSRRRPKLAQEAVRIQAELHLTVDAAGVLSSSSSAITSEDALRQRLVGSFSSEQVQALWQKLFEDDEQVDTVAWDTFLATYETVIDHKIDSDQEITLKHVLDIDSIGGVTARAFNNFLKIFGPIEKSFKNVKTLFKQKWFHGFLTVEEVIRLLSDQPVGTFLVRFSRSKPDSFVLEFVEAKGKIHTTMITNDMPNGVRILEAAGKEKTFPSIKALIENYASTMKFPFVSDFLFQPWFHGDLSTAEATELLSKCPIGTFMIRFSDTGRFTYALSYSTADDARPDHPLVNEVKHIDIYKVPSGYTIGAEHASAPASNATSIVRDIEKENGTVIYSSLGKLISEWRHILRYNYSPEHVPSIRLVDYGEAPDQVDLIGPGNTVGVGSKGGFGPHNSFISAECTVTYPKDSYPWMVVCDQYAVRVLGNRTVFALADGCGPGKTSREAAVRACRTIIDRLGNKGLQTTLLDTNDIKRVLLRAFAYAHDAIAADVETAGTTTLIAGMFVQLDTGNPDPEYGLVFTNVGDCKAYIWNSETRSVIDLTAGNRQNIRDPKDPGGRLGPFIGNGPDLRNLSSCFWPLSPGDVVFVASDGVHDNFDAEACGITPAAVAKKIKKHPLATKELRKAAKEAGNSWDNVPHDKLEPLKTLYQTEGIRELILHSQTVDAASITDVCVQHAIKTTEPSRSWMEADPRNVEPDDHVAFPGKMDHTSIISLQAAAYFPKSRLRIHKYTGAAATAAPVVSGSTAASSPSSPTLPQKQENQPKSSASSSSSSSSVGPCEQLKDKLLLNLPRVEIAAFASGDYVKLLTGPTSSSEGELKLGSAASGWSTSTYPKMTAADGAVQRIGDPNSNVFAVEFTRTRITAVLTGSSSWGNAAAQACHAAAQTFLDAISRAQQSISSIAEAKLQSLRAFDTAHQQLISMATPTSKATSGMLSALMMREQDNTKKWIVLVTSVGNSKLFLWRKGDKTVRDLTFHSTPANREDAGGRIGDYAPGGAPDLRNLFMSSEEVDEGDIIFALSTVAQNNFEPDVVGDTPQDLDTLSDLGDDVTWETLLKTNPQRLVDVRDGYRCTMFADLFSEHGDKLDPSKVSQSVVQHCVDKTKKTRAFLEANPYANPPSDFGAYPGKVGHTTCLAIRIGVIPKAELQQNALLPTVASPLFKTN